MTRQLNKKTTQRNGIKRWRQNNPGKHREHGRKYRQGMTSERLEIQRKAVRKYKTGTGKEKARAYSKEYGQRNKIELRNIKLKNRYGLETGQYEALLQGQGGVCAICKQSYDYPLNVDHCHRTNIVRGLLCRGCNSLLGNAKDSALRLQAASSYIERFNVNED